MFCKVISLLEEFNEFAQELNVEQVTSCERVRRDWVELTTASLGYAKIDDPKEITKELLLIPHDLKNWLNNKLTSYRRRDRIHGHKESDIYPRELYKMFLENDCVYCGESNMHKKTLDRIDHSMGHTKDNVVVACIDCNTERNNKVTVQRFKAFNLMVQSYNKKHPTIINADELPLEYSGSISDTIRARDLGVEIRKEGNTIIYIFRDGEIPIERSNV